MSSLLKKARAITKNKVVQSPQMSSALLNAILRSDLQSFIRKVFGTLNPSTPYLDNWHIAAIAWQLEQVRLGQTKRLIITMPPRSLKSISASVAFPAFIHGHDPSKSIICVSYGQDLATKMQNDYRSVLASRWYQNLFPATRIGAVKDSENEVMLTGRGLRLATSISGTLTGRGGDIVIIDDPLKPIDALSDVKRNAVNEWFGSTLLSRLNDKQTGAIIIVTQRVHADDLVGHVLERSGEDWMLLELPAIAFSDVVIPIGLTRRYHRRADEVLHPAREPGHILDSIRKELGSEAFAAQYLQCPVPPGGNLFKRDWLYRYTEMPADDEDGSTYQSWDTASKTAAQNDYSVCTTWRVIKGKYYLLDVIRGKFEYPELKAKAIEAAQSWNPSHVLIEDTGVGTGLIAELVYESINAIGVQPVQSKIARASIQSAKFEAERVLFPPAAPWLSDLEAELLAFPSGRHDDQVDSIVQMLGYEIPEGSVLMFSWDRYGRMRRID
jgi:predicted phage terminase large subunit-like protein